MPNQYNQVQKKSTSILPTFIVMASAVIILAGMQSMSDILTMTFMAFIIAICVSPLIGWLKKKGLSNSISLAITIIIVVFTGLGLTLFSWISLGKIVISLPQYFESFDVRINEAQQFIESGSGFDISIIKNTENVKKLIGFALSQVTVIIGSIVSIVFMMFLTAYMLHESMHIKEKLNRNLNKSPDALTRLKTYVFDIKNYVFISAKMGALAAVINVMLFYAMGIDFAILWGLLSFFMSFIPSIGFFLAIIPPTFMALIQYGWMHALVLLILMWLINGIVDQFIKPKQMGSGLDISPLIIFWSVLFWGFILGPIGGLLAVPLSLGFKNLILGSNKDTKWISDIMKEK